MTIHGKFAVNTSKERRRVSRIVSKKHLFGLLCIVFLGFIIVSCTSNKKDEENFDVNQNEVVLIEGNLSGYEKDWQIDQKQTDTLMFLDAFVGARAQMSFIDNDGEHYQFGENVSNVNFIDEQTLEGIQKLKNKTFILQHRKLTMKGSDSDEFAGDKEIEVITAVGNSPKPLHFKGLRSRYKLETGRFTRFEMGDLAHYIFELKNGEEFDFNGMNDDFFDFDYDQEKYKNKQFLIFYKDENFVDPDNGAYTSSIIYKLIPMD
jgi:hypothetical protein